MLVFALITVAIVIYVLYWSASDWLKEEFAALSPESRSATAGILLLLLWYAMHGIWNSLGVRRTYGETSTNSLLLFLLLFALLLWQALKR